MKPETSEKVEFWMTLAGVICCMIMWILHQIWWGILSNVLIWGSVYLQYLRHQE